MDRILEPELMEDPEQVLAYARADFASVNQAFVDRFCTTFPDLTEGVVLDLGCGPADIPLRLLRARPGLRIVALDGSGTMLAEARRAIAAAGAVERVQPVRARIPHLPFPDAAFDAIISNSLVHHLPDPHIFWRAVRRLARPGAALQVVDLFRPDSPQAARALVAAAAGGEHPVLQADFYNSLLAAFSPEEVQRQLVREVPGLAVRVVSERHWEVAGRLIPGR